MRIAMPVRWRRLWGGAVAATMLGGLAGCAGGQAAPGPPQAPSPSPTATVTVPRSYLYVVSPSGGAPHPLLSAADAARLQNVADPVWSPDGRQIAFAAGCLTCSAKLYLVSRTGQDLREIPTGPGAVSSPGWSPDGHSLVFERQQGERQFIYSVNLLTGRLRLVNGEPAGADNTDSTPAWSPDGRTIAFVREIRHERVNMYRVPASGGKPVRLTHATQFGQDRPRWSPDGREIVFMQTVPPEITWDLDILDVATGKVSPLTRDPHNEFDPAWSPDGQSVVFASDALSGAGFRSLFVIQADGAGLRRLTKSTADDSMPTWSPDGTSIVFVRRPTKAI